MENKYKNENDDMDNTTMSTQVTKTINDEMEEDQPIFETGSLALSFWFCNKMIKIIIQFILL